jgi:hypothetical protein
LKTRSAPAGPTSLRPTTFFSKLDQDGDGTVSLDEMSSALKGNGHHHASYNVAARETQPSPAPAALGARLG